MKKFAIIFTSIIAIILLAMIVVPYFFKDKILAFTQEQANKSLNAKVEISDVSLSMFKHFPQLSVEINNLVITGTGVFEQDTLANISSLGAAVNLCSLISGESIDTKGIFLKDAKLMALVNKEGKENWDIVKTSSEKTANTEEQESDLKIKFESISVENLFISLIDKKKNINFSSDNFALIMSGNFSEENTNINLKLTSDNTNAYYGKIKYLNNTRIEFDAVIEANLKEEIFKFMDNKLSLNNFELAFEGSIDLNKDETLVDIELKTNNNDFKALLSMIPGEFKKDLKDVETSGNLQFSAFAKGILRENSYPAFAAELNIKNASIKYPSLPESIDNINISAQLANPGGDLDSTLINLSNFHLDIAKNPFAFTLFVKNPISDAELKGSLIANIDFKNLKKAIPLKDVKIEGLVNANIAFDGKMSFIENEQYDKFMTTGNIVLKNFVYDGKDVPKTVYISNSILNFSSKQISLQSFDAAIGGSDFSLKGSIKNFIPYAMKGSTLFADFSMSSKFINSNELMPKNKKKTADNEKKDIPLSVIEIPKNLKLNLKCNISKLLYDNMSITNVMGLVSVKDSKANLSGIKMNLLEGNLKLNGEYNAQNIESPKTNFNMNASKIDIKSAYNSFSIIKEMVPMALNCSGKLSVIMDIKSSLNNKMEIIASSLNGSGNISSEKIIVNQNDLLDGLAKLSKDESYKTISIDKIDMNFTVVDGNISLKPFETTVAGNKTKIYGSQSVTGIMDYTIESSVEKKMLGDKINNTLNIIPGYKNLDKIDIDVKIGGLLDKPTVTPNLARAQKQITEAAKKEFLNKTKKDAKELIEKEMKNHLDENTQKKAVDILNKLFR